MLISQEQADRLKNNLVFDPQDSAGAVGMIQILVRNETQESVKELFTLLAGLLSRSDALIDLDVTIPVFDVSISSPDSPAAE